MLKFYVFRWGKEQHKGTKLRSVNQRAPEIYFSCASLQK